MMYGKMKAGMADKKMVAKKTMKKTDKPMAKVKAKKKK